MVLVVPFHLVFVVFKTFIILFCSEKIMNHLILSNTLTNNELLFFLDEPVRIVENIMLPPMVLYSNTLNYDDDVDIFQYNLDHFCLFEKHMFCFTFFGC